MSETILVTGASGKTGLRVVSALAGAGLAVRGSIRRPEAEAQVRAAGAREIATGDLLDARSLRSAMQGAGQVLHICPPMHPQEDGIARAITDLCKELGTRRLILWSVLHPVIEVPHHRRKLTAEQYLIESGQPYTILQPCRYMQHLASVWKAVSETGIHAMPFSAQSKFSLVDLDDLAAAAAVVCARQGDEFATYQLAGPDALSQDDCAAILSQLLGKPVRAEAKSFETFRAEAQKAGMPEHRLETMAVMNAHYDAHGLRGNPHVLEWLLGRRPSNFADYVKREYLAK